MQRIGNRVRHSGEGRNPGLDPGLRRGDENGMGPRIREYDGYSPLRLLEAKNGMGPRIREDDD